MSIFKKPIQFRQHDPLADGLGDEISAERKEADSFATLDDISGEELSKQWTAIIKDVEKDPDWFSFSSD